VRFVNNNSVGGYSPLPFACLLTNSFIWMLYGTLLEDFVIWVPHSVGICVGVGCVAAYQSVSCAMHLATYLPVSLAGCFALFCAYSRDIQSLGLLGCAMTILMIGAPLVTLRSVLANKSTASMSLPVTVVSFFNGASWALYGALIAEDPMIYGPSLIGMALSGLQLCLFACYGFGAPSRKLVPPLVLAPSKAPDPTHRPRAQTLTSISEV